MEYAFEGEELSGEGKPSVFTTAVVRGLESGEADRDQDRLISVDDLYDYVCEHVREVTPHQRPNMLSHLEGALYIARSSYVVPVTPAPLPAPLVAAIDNPLAGVRGGAVGELTALLEHGEPGTAAAARAALTTLTGDDSRRVGAAAAEALSKDRSVPPLSGSAALTDDTRVPPAAPERNPEPAADRAPDRAAAIQRPVHRRRNGRTAAIASLVLTVLGGLGVAVVAAFTWETSWIGWAEVALIGLGVIAIAAAVARHLPAGAERRPALSAMIVLAGGFSLGAALAVAAFEPSFGEGGTEAPVALGAVAVLVGGVLGVDQRGTSERRAGWLPSRSLSLPCRSSARCCRGCMTRACTTTSWLRWRAACGSPSPSGA